MKKYVCTVCGYIAEGSIPEQCPVCKAPASAFVEKTGNTYVTEHVVGIGKAEGVLRRSLTVCAQTLRVSAARSACTWPWPVWQSARLPRDR